MSSLLAASLHFSFNFKPSRTHPNRNYDDNKNNNDNRRNNDDNDNGDNDDVNDSITVRDLGHEYVFVLSQRSF